VTYYRVARQPEASPIWTWESRVTTALDMVFRMLKLYRTIPRDSIRVFCAPSAEGLDEMLVRENQGLMSSSLTAEQLFNESEHLSPQEGNQHTPAGGLGVGMGMAGACMFRERAWDEHLLSAAFKESRSFLEMRRLEVELGAPGDHDTS
jgi:hypothetical protein